MACCDSVSVAGKMLTDGFQDGAHNVFSVKYLLGFKYLLSWFRSIRHLIVIKVSKAVIR